MKIIVTSLFVQDQDKALEFYSETLGFVKKHDIPMGKFRWITLVSPDDQDGTELFLEPNEHPTAKEYQKKIFAEASQQQCLALQIFVKSTNDYWKTA